ncbi:MAG: DUF6261 family protein [Anaerovoracaceae bacterium]
MKTKSLDLSKLRNGEHFQFHTDIKNLVQKFTPEKLSIQEAFQKYLLLYAHEDEVLEKIRKSATTAQIAEADTTRDITFKGLVEAVSTAQKHFKPEVREAARKVQILFDTYGKIADLPYNEETAKIYNLIEEMKKEYAADIATMKLEDWVQELDKNNKQFDTLMNQRYDEQLSKATTNPREIRSQIDVAYKSMMDIVNAYAIISTEPAYKQFIQELNLRIDYYNNTLAQRRGRNKEEEGDTPIDNGQLNN